MGRASKCSNVVVLTKLPKDKSYLLLFTFIQVFYYHYSRNRDLKISVYSTNKNKPNAKANQSTFCSGPILTKGLNQVLGLNVKCKCIKFKPQPQLSVL